MLDMAQTTYRIEIMWDNETGVFIAHSDDIYGLNTEASTIPKLVKQVCQIAPELLELNGVTQDINQDSFLFDPRSFLVPYEEQACG